MAQTLIVIGGGNMGGAILRGNLAAGLIPRERVVVVEPDQAKAPALSALAGGVVESASQIPASNPDTTTILLGVKPQVFTSVAQELGTRAPALRGVLVASIMAGIPLERIARDCPWAGACVRLMPNLPASVGRGVTAMCPDAHCTPPQIARIRAIFEQVGAVIDLQEPLIDAFTAVAGSGPAYVFLLAEAMSLGAQAAGFSREQADRISRATISGSAAMLDADPRDAGAMREAVTSKGGTTEAALRVLADSDWTAAMERAIIAGRDRARALAK
jgi:pyrroline-5-carboxylate reductase